MKSAFSMRVLLLGTMVLGSVTGLTIMIQKENAGQIRAYDYEQASRLLASGIPIVVNVAFDDPPNCLILRELLRDSEINKLMRAAKVEIFEHTEYGSPHFPLHFPTPSERPYLVLVSPKPQLTAKLATTRSEFEVALRALKVKQKKTPPNHLPKNSFCTEGLERGWLRR